jgi:hypothetical protein
MKCLVQRAASDEVQCIFLSPLDMDLNRYDACLKELGGSTSPYFCNSRITPDNVPLDDFITRIETKNPSFQEDSDSDD